MYRTNNFQLGGRETGLVRLAFAQSLFEARAFSGGTPKFGATFIIDAKDTALLKILRSKVVECVESEWGQKGLDFLQKGIIKNPILDGAKSFSKKTGEVHNGFGPGTFFIRVQSGADRPPVIIWKDPNKRETEATVYSGCSGKCVLNAYCWKHPQSGDGVSFGIFGFQKLAEGDRLGGGEVSGESFYEAFTDAPQETKSGAGAGALFDNAKGIEKTTAFDDLLAAKTQHAA